MTKEKYSQIALTALAPYPNNARTHSEAQINKIAKSLEEFGFVNPVLIDDKNMIIAGHGRVLAAKKIGLKTVPCVRVEGLTDAQIRAYILADNKLAEDAGWDMTLVNQELTDLANMDFDIDLTGFEFPDDNEWFKREDKEGEAREEGNDEYNEFLDKFEAPKTTDDCYTPDNIYEAVADWVAKEYKLNKKQFIRPFYPGGDYEQENYQGRIVVDNPPFSILSEIETFYVKKGVKFFLFAPHVSNFPSGRKCCAICVGVGVTYENGAVVSTSFVTNLEDNAARTAPDLYQIIDKINKENTAGNSYPVYEYPKYVVTAAKLSYLSKYGQKLVISQKDASEKIGMLDAQKEAGKGIFGGGFLISEKAAAEKAAAIEWKLSDREMEIIRGLG